MSNKTEISRDDCELIAKALKSYIKDCEMREAAYIMAMKLDEAKTERARIQDLEDYIDLFGNDAYDITVVVKPHWGLGFC